MMFIFGYCQTGNQGLETNATSILKDGADGVYYQFGDKIAQPKPINIKNDKPAEAGLIPLTPKKATPLPSVASISNHHDAAVSVRDIVTDIVGQTASYRNACYYFSVGCGSAEGNANAILKCVDQLLINKEQVVIAVENDLVLAQALKARYPDINISVEYEEEPDESHQKQLYASKIDIVTLPITEIHESFVNHLHRRAIQIFAKTELGMAKEILYDQLMIPLKLRIDGLITDQVVWSSSVIKGQVELNRTWHEQQKTSKHPNHTPKAEPSSKKRWTDRL